MHVAQQGEAILMLRAQALSQDEFNSAWLRAYVAQMQSTLYVKGVVLPHRKSIFPNALLL